MSRIMFITDTHLKAENFLEKNRALYGYVCDSDYDLLIHGGDLFDNATVQALNSKQLASYPADQLVCEVNQVFSMNSKPKIILSGNHDQFGSEYHALNLLNGPSLTKILKPTVLELSCSVLILIPWTRYPNSYKERVLAEIGSIKNEKPIYLFGHMSVVGAQMGFKPVDPRTYFCFDVDDFSHLNIKAAYLGHLHSRQSVGNFHYTGPMQQNNFGEEDFPYGAMILNTVTGDTEFLTHRGLEYRTVYSEEDPLWVNRSSNSLIRVRLKGNKQISTSSKSYELAPLSFTLNESVIDAYLEEKGFEDVKQHPLMVQAKPHLVKAAPHYPPIPSMIDRVAWRNCVIPDREANFKEGLNIIIGPNGSGKTSLVEIPYAALYGVFSRRGNIKGFLGKGTIEVDLMGHKIKLEKSTKELDGFSYTLTGEYYQEIERLFGPKKQFSDVILGDQHGTTSLPALGATEALYVFRNLLGLPDYEVLYKNAKYSRQALLDTLENVKQQKLILESAPRKAEPSNMNYIGLHREVTTLKAKIASIKEAKSKVRANQDYADWLKSFQDFEHKWGVRPSHEVLQYYSTRKEAQQQLRILESDSKRYCGMGCKDNPIMECSFLSNYEDHLERRRELETSLSDSSDIPEVALNEMRSILLKESLFRSRTPTDLTPEELQLSQQSLTVLELQLNSKLSAMSEIESYQENCEWIERIENIIKDLPTEEDLLLKIRVHEALMAITAKDGLSAKLLESAVNDLNRILSYLEQNSGLSFGVEAKLSAKGLEFTYSEGKSLGLMSGGQFNLACLLVRMALGCYIAERTGRETMLILDEPTTGVDRHNLVLVGALLESMTQRGTFRQIIVVTHCEELIPFAENLISL